MDTVFGRAKARPDSLLNHSNIRAFRLFFVHLIQVDTEENPHLSDPFG